MQIEMLKIKLVKNPNTKTTYLEESRGVEEITETQYKNICSDDTLKWFRRLGGSESAERGYTCRGYRVVKLTSTSPNKQSKTIREFNFN
jgi:hypothetical protein